MDLKNKKSGMEGLLTISNGGDRKTFIPDNITLPEETQWLTIYIDTGKKHKINKMDVADFLRMGQREKHELGIMGVLNQAAFVAIKRNRADQLLRMLKKSASRERKTAESH